MLTIVVAGVGALVARFLVHSAQRAEAGHQARDLSARRRWRLPDTVRRWFVSRLDAAAITIEPEAVCELWFAAAVGLIFPAAVLAPGLGVAVAIGALAAGPVVFQVLRGRARRRMVVALPGALEHVAAGLRGGATVGEALEALANSESPLASDLGRVRARASLGPGLGDALASWATERDLTSVRATCGALAVAASVGGPAAGAIDGLAGSLRDRLGAAAEARALSAQARLSALVVGAAPLAYLTFSAVADPSSLQVLVRTSGGRLCLVLGLGFEAVAAVWMRRIVLAEDDE